MNLVDSFVNVAPLPGEAMSRSAEPAAALPPRFVPASPHSVQFSSERPDAVKLALKGTTIPVIAVMIPTCALDAIEAALEAKVGGARAFFEGEAALLDVSRCYEAVEAHVHDEAGGAPGERADNDTDAGTTEDGEAAGAGAGGAALDYAALAVLVRRYGLVPVAVRGAPQSAIEAIKAAGLAAVAGAAPMRARSPAPSMPASTSLEPGVAVMDESAAALRAPSMTESDRVQGELGLDDPGGVGAADAAAVTDGTARSEPGQSTPPAPAEKSEPGQSTSPASAEKSEPGQSTSPASAEKSESVEVGALVVDKAMRSGQRVYAKGRDLVVLAQVNPGAELIADGSIHCYAPLRGRAVAGASGNTKATIFASNFQAELVSIAGVYKTFETIPAAIAGRQMCVRLREHDGASHIALDLINTE